MEQLRDVANIYKTHKTETPLYIVLYGDAGAFLLFLLFFVTCLLCTGKGQNYFVFFDFASHCVRVLEIICLSWCTLL